MEPYILYIDGMEIPVTPSKIKEDIKGNNEILNLLNGEPYTVLRDSKLPVFSFSFYAFSSEHPGVATYISQDEIIKKFRDLKKEKKVFEFIILRSSSDISLRNSICEYTTLEDFTIDEDSKYGTNNLVNLKLQMYYPLKTIKLTDKKTDGDKKQAYQTITTGISKTTTKLALSATLSKGDTTNRMLSSNLTTDKFKAMQDKKRSGS